MLKRLALIGLGAGIALSACTQTPSVPSPTNPASNQYRIQQQQDEEGTSDSSLDAIIRDLDSGTDDQAATQSPTPMQSQRFSPLQIQQGGYGWYGGYGYGPYGYGIFARCQRIYRRCLSRAYYYYSGYNTYQFCRRIRNRCIRAVWLSS